MRHIARAKVAVVWVSTCLGLTGCVGSTSLGNNPAAAGGGGSTSSDAGAAGDGSIAGAPAAMGGQSGADAAGSAGQTSEAGATAACAEPGPTGCPDGLTEFEGQQADLQNHCLMPAAALSCSASATGLETCWANSSTNATYFLVSGPCLPSARWRECTPSEKASLDAVKQRACE